LTGKLTYTCFDSDDLKEVLAKKQPQIDVKELLKGLQLTIEFESQLSKRFSQQVRGTVCMDGYVLGLLTFISRLKTTTQPPRLRLKNPYHPFLSRISDCT
jgi:hypothetical protein